MDESNLGSAAGGAKCNAVADGSMALIAGMFHCYQKYRTQTGPANEVFRGKTASRAPGPKPKANLDCRVLAAGAHIHQGKVGPLALRFDGDKVLIAFRAHF